MTRRRLVLAAALPFTAAAGIACTPPSTAVAPYIIVHEADWPYPVDARTRVDVVMNGTDSAAVSRCWHALGGAPQWGADGALVCAYVAHGAT